MSRFALGFLLFPLASCAAVGVQDVLQGQFSAAGFAWLLLEILVIPATFAVLAAQLVHLWTPRKIMDRHRAGSWRATVHGMIVGGFFLGASSLGLALLPRCHEGLLMVMAAGLCTMAYLALFTRRRLPGLCVACGYDICASLDFGRCPECGTSV